MRIYFYDFFLSFVKETQATLYCIAVHVYMHALETYELRGGPPNPMLHQELYM